MDHFKENVTEWKQDYYRDFLIYCKQFKYKNNLCSILDYQESFSKVQAKG